MKLELQYKKYLQNNPDSDLSMERWIAEILSPVLYKALHESSNPDHGVVWSDNETETSNIKRDEN